MPYDGDVTAYEAPVKPEVFSVEALRDWLLTRDPAETYRFWNCYGGCLLEQYLEACGIPGRVKDSNGNYRYRRFTVAVPAAQANIAAPTPHTFGEALARANAYLAERG